MTHVTGSRRRLLPIAIAMVVALALFVVPPFIAPAAPGAGIFSLRAYLEQLRSRVDTPAGAPRPGGDPAAQKQQSLASAAAQPKGLGRRVTRPARAVRGGRGRGVTSVQIYGALKRRGLNAAGCFFDYGRPGEQCLPAHVARGLTVTCTDVRAHFPDGIPVWGTDRFRLDRNRDRIACGPGD